MKKNDDIEECDIVAGGAASDGLQSPVGMTTTDVLGKCDHSKGKGFFDKDCFHIPKPVFAKPLSRIKGSKRKNGMFITDAQLSKQMILSIHKVSESIIIKFIQKNWNLKSEIDHIESIAYFPVKCTLFIKFKYANSSKCSFVQTEFVKNKFKAVDTTVYTASEVKEKYRELDRNLRNRKIWLVWGF